MHQMVAAWLKTHHLPLTGPLTREGLCMGFAGVTAGVSVPSLTKQVGTCFALRETTLLWESTALPDVDSACC